MIRHLITALAATLLAAMPLAAAPEAAPQHPDRPLLWKVEGNGLQKPSWLFGTIHLAKGPIANLHPLADKALQDSDTVYTELPMDTATQIGMVKHFIRIDGKTLSQSVGDEIHQHLTAELKAINPQLTPAIFESFKTWAVGLTIPLLEMQLKGATAIDMIVWNKAEAAGKQTAAIEKAEDQLGIFEKLTEAEQTTYLCETLRICREAREQKIDRLGNYMTTYQKGDPELFEKLIAEEMAKMAEGEHRELGERIVKQLFDDRNASMTKTMANHLKQQPAKSHFFAVGAGHYVGKNNIGDQLRQLGYTVTLITP